LRTLILGATVLFLAVLVMFIPGEAASSARLRIGFVVGVSDPAEHGAFVGLQRAVDRLHVQVKVVTPSPKGGFGPAFSYLGRQKYDLIIGSGLDETYDMAIAARKFPATKFVLLDVPVEALNGRPPNVAGAVFSTQQPSYLAGYLAARLEKTKSKRLTISAVGGAPIPPVQVFIAGYTAGAHRADPRVTVLTAYANDFVSAAKCRRVALAQIAQGSGVVFDVAGGCGLGALAAAKSKGAWGIGVDIDQSYLGPFILTSVLKRLDVAVYDVVQSLRQNRLKTGGNLIFDYRNNGVGLGKFGPAVTPSLRHRLRALRAQIARGEIVVPTTVK
jgi:basic membrane protein A